MISEEKKDTYKLDIRSKWMLGIAVLAILFSFIAPYLFIKFSIFDVTGAGSIGDSLGGIMNPFIAIGGVILTYLAFYMQFSANKIQREQFRMQIREDKIKFKRELDEQQLEFKKSQFENQFYEMIRLHKENINEISLTLYLVNSNGFDFKTIIGREVFKYLNEEIKILYYIAKKCYNTEDFNLIINIAYGLFFHGIKYDETITEFEPGKEQFSSFINRVLLINHSNTQANYRNLKSLVANYTDYKSAANLKFKLGQGHSFYLAHYYRHLFQTVKYVANQDENFISYEDKRKYLRILRAQLSNQEQAMLFYNWKSDFGKNWEDKNKFFTDFRMIHNLYNDLLIEDFILEKLFDLNREDVYRKEKNREIDPLFEFEDWI